MALQQWPKEPTDFCNLALHHGDPKSIQTFIDIWFSWEGALDFHLAPITLPDTLTASPGNPLGQLSVRISDHAVEHRNGRPATALFMPRLPAYDMVRWFLDRPDWTMLYLPCDGDEPLSMPDHLNEKLFHPWGFVANGSDSSDASSAPLGVRPDAFNLFTSHFNGQQGRPETDIAIDGRIGIATPSSKRSSIDSGGIDSGAAGRLYQVPIRLAREYSDRSRQETERRIPKLEQEIAQRTEDLAFCKWWAEEANARVPCQIYIEAEADVVGSHIELLKWFSRVPDVILNGFRHTRIALQPLSETGDAAEKGSAFHILIPADFRQPIPGAPPRGYRTLNLDPYWRRKGYHHFVPEGEVLWPPPPLDNEHATTMMANRLWRVDQTSDELSSDNAFLFFMRDETGDTIRFEVAEKQFKPLPGQIDTLNIYFDLKMTRPPLLTEAEEAASRRRAARRFEESIARQAADQASGIRNALSVMCEEIPPLDGLTKEVADARTLVQDFERDQKRLTEHVASARAVQWNQWHTFLQEVLTMDRAATLPKTESASIEKSLKGLDEARGALSKLWGGIGLGRDRDEVASSLMTLSRAIDAVARDLGRISGDLKTKVEKL